MKHKNYDYFNVSEKSCVRCKNVKSKEDFRIQKKEGRFYLMSYCVDCEREMKPPSKKTVRSRKLREKGLKECPKCKMVKSTKEFAVDSSKASNVGTYCIICEKKRLQKLNKENPKPITDRIKLMRELRINKLKKCPRCKEIKPISEYGTDKNSAYGISCYCFECSKQKVKKYRTNQNKRQNYRRKHDIQFRIAKIYRNRVLDALKSKNVTKKHSSKDILGCSIEYFKKHLESQFTEGMTWNNQGFYGWHIDHIRPCSSFDLSDVAQQKECFHYSNQQPLWARENLQKNNKLDWKSLK